MALPSSNPKVEHVFVLMLENHSFDNMLGRSGIPGLPNIERFSNSYNGTTYRVGTDPAPCSMSTDPGHEMIDVLQQLTNNPPNDKPNTTIPSPYPTINPNNFPNGTGFVTNYMNNFDEDNKTLPTNPGDVMKCFSADQVPVLSKLAAQYAVCNNWFSSIPGPTWPNRLFAHFGSSLGLDVSPTTTQIAGWYSSGINDPQKNPSIFDKLGTGNYHIYSDYDPRWFVNHFPNLYRLYSQFSDNPQNGGTSGAVPQVNSINGIPFSSVKSVYENFEGDLNNANYPAYTFIEPHYGDIYDGTYAGGSSQHPKDDIAGGEALIKFVYEKLRANTAMWEKSLLIITYDEHGGFYDSVPPDRAVIPSPTAPNPYKYNQLGFKFDQYGVRVPAVIISPYIQAGTVSSTVYDHTSILATLRKIFTTVNGLPLTNRDRNAADVLPLLNLRVPRTDTVTFAPAAPCPSSTKIVLTDEQQAHIYNQPLPESGNMIGTMGILLKTHYEHSPKNFITRALLRNKLKSIKTRGDLKAYGDYVLKKVLKARKK